MLEKILKRISVERSLILDERWCRVLKNFVGLLVFVHFSKESVWRTRALSYVPGHGKSLEAVPSLQRCSWVAAAGVRLLDLPDQSQSKYLKKGHVHYDEDGGRACLRVHTPMEGTCGMGIRDIPDTGWQDGAGNLLELWCWLRAGPEGNRLQSLSPWKKLQEHIGYLSCFPDEETERSSDLSTAAEVIRDTAESWVLMIQLPIMSYFYHMVF